MSYTDYPSHADKAPPPTKEAEEYLRDEIKSVRNGIGGFLIAGFTVSRTLQIFSRKPGSSGIMLLLAWIPAAFIQHFYFLGCVENYGRTDATPYELLILVQLAMWFCGVLIFLSRNKAPKHRSLGNGLLGKLFPHTAPNKVGIISDAAIGLLLIVLLHALQSPTQAGWYQAITCWTLFCHGCIYLHGWSLRQRVKAAKRRAKHWRKDVRGRHHL